MARPFAEQFYSSMAWQNCRDAYRKSRRGLCELCLAKGIITAGVIVHHKKHITPQNISDPNITLNWDNLQLLCAEHHAEVHKKRDGQRYVFDPYGNCVVDDN